MERLHRLFEKSENMIVLY